MRGWWREAAGLLLPAGCGGCGRPRTALCEGCRQALCGAGPRRVRPSPEPPGLPVVHAAAPYEDAVRAVLLGHKERGALELAGALGGALAGAVLVGASGAGAPGTRRSPDGDVSGGCGPLLLVPVPSARRATRARGHDPTRRIALAASGELRRAGVAARVLAVLRQRRAVSDQSGLRAPERLANLAGALEMVAGGPGLLEGRRVVLVDDLMTTGASLVEAARALRAAVPPDFHGFRHLSAAVVAAPSLSFGINRN
ncbi:phosphoribosyltransferase family protein [Streptomyces sp. H27-C3]|uniref:ComF family protein n=1 Tax=Streptomyces sp. H27-C3 TaxID=3046305 RepID=UPI0024BAB891|nr:phosphoribosyltransferase family protein [Streptomyces sp. H27-C3]MDJ0461212.1 phosphoribosyltransferase family protein [Streptomyces sp. H27-C3]